VVALGACMFIVATALGGVIMVDIMKLLLDAGFEQNSN
jgi:hypothetical protein